MPLKISDLTAGVAARIGNLIEMVQTVGGVLSSRKVALEQIFPSPAELAPAVANVMDDEFDGIVFDTVKWTQINPGTTSISVGSGSLQISCPAVNSQNVRGIFQTLPVTPWEFTTKVNLNGPWNTNHQIVGLALRDATGKVVTYGLGYSTTNRLRVDNWNSPTAISGTALSKDGPAPQAFLKIRDTGVNRIFSSSLDGINYYTFLTQANNAFLTATQIGLFWYWENTTDFGMFTSPFFRRTL